jgi:DNA-binding NarL/FixJ family response regulator
MPTPTSPTKTRQILLVDDDEMMRILFQEMFWIYSQEETGVHTVRSFLEASAFLDSAPQAPDVVVLGLSLRAKGSPGLAFIQDVRRKHAHTKVVVYSQHEEKGLKAGALEAGADVYLVKGQHTPKELVSFIEGL